MALQFTDLLAAYDFEGFKARMLATADSLGLSTSSWRPTDPTRSIISIAATIYAELNDALATLHNGGFLSYATEGLLTVLAREAYGVERIVATYASGEATLTSTATAPYVIAVGDLTVQSSTTGKTYRNQTGGTLLAGGTLTLDFQAEEAGADSSALATEVDTLASVLLGVTVSNADAWVGADAETDADLRDRCRESLAAVSPNGAVGAYRYSALTAVDSDGNSYGITRVKAVANYSTGAVVVYLATDAGAPLAGTVTAVDEIAQATVVPLAVTVTHSPAVEVSTDVTATLYASDASAALDAEIEEAAENAMIALFAATPIGGYTAGADTNVLFQSEIEAKLSESHSDVFRAVAAVPAADLALGTTGVPVLGTVTITIVRVAL